MTTSRLKLFSLIITSALIIMALVAFVALRGQGVGAGLTAPGIVAENFGGPFTLTDYAGHTVTDKDFSGRYRLIYFGFTYCPAICPTELAKISQTMKLLGDDADKITPMFITIDPERDTPDVVAKYVTMFDPRFVGLTGTPEQIKQVAGEYKIYFAKVEDPALTDYTMDHSSFIYFMDPDDNLLAIYRADDTAEKMATEIAPHLTSAAD
jgi:cytochrome oxidase Cu insertion factor (SCO1/SenC/PrrC family)